MTVFEGRAWLDWWANSVTNLGGVEVSVVIGDDAAADGHLVRDEDREGFEFLCQLDPVFTLRFEDESTVEVTVHPSADYCNFTLTEFA